MATKVLDKCIPVEYVVGDEKKTTWKKVGVVFIKEDGKMWGIDECIPIDWDGRYQLFEQKQRDDRGPEPSSDLPF